MQLVAKTKQIQIETISSLVFGRHYSRKGLVNVIKDIGINARWDEKADRFTFIQASIGLKRKGKERCVDLNA